MERARCSLDVDGYCLSVASRFNRPRMEDETKRREIKLEECRSSCGVSVRAVPPFVGNSAPLPPKAAWPASAIHKPRALPLLRPTAPLLWAVPLAESPRLIPHPRSFLHGRCFSARSGRRQRHRVWACTLYPFHLRYADYLYSLSVLCCLVSAWLFGSLWCITRSWVLQLKIQRILVNFSIVDASRG